MDDYVFTASWIPVTEQMPPIGVDVIVSTKRSVNRAWWDEEVWHMASHSGRFVKTVLAWMPLPKRFKKS